MAMYLWSDFYQATLEGISYIDHPEIRVDEHESTEMPFRYIKDKNGEPIMPPVSLGVPFY